MIPTELAIIDHWISWKQVGKDKKPLDPTGRVANALDPKNWRSIIQIMNTNIGFVLTGDYIVVDGDHEPWITELTNYFVDKTYCEVSPNGGIHVWLKGSIRNRRGNFEVYSDKRWMTVTDNGNDMPITKLTKEDEEWITKMIK
jgi:primase-polymerase (primpol)-like protein